MLKEVTVGSMIKPCGEDQPPTLEELQQFRKRKSTKSEGYDDEEDEEDENEGSKMASSLLDELSELQGKTGVGGKANSGGGLIISRWSHHQQQLRNSEYLGIYLTQISPNLAVVSSSESPVNLAVSLRWTRGRR